MIKVTIGNNVKRFDTTAEETDTLRSVLDENGVDYSRGTMHMDGSALRPGDLDKSFAELGYTGEEGHNRCFLMNVVKADNA